MFKHRVNTAEALKLQLNIRSKKEKTCIIKIFNAAFADELLPWKR